MNINEPMSYNPEEHRIVVSWSEDDKAWLASIPAIENCIAFGETPQEAVEEVKIAAGGMLETAKKYGYSYRKDAP